jgi:polysaccharide pyruvyl transferase WcaK-like protein
VAVETATILIGAFDRHNFGDLLFAHVVGAMSGRRNRLFAGVADRDLRAVGGHRVHALPRLAERLAQTPVNIIHAGGELLTCDTYEAAVMTLPADLARQAIARLDARPCERTTWAQALLRTTALAPYTVSRDAFRGAARVLYNAVGGVDLATRDSALHAEVLSKLAAADDISVRDKRSQALLSAAGVESRLIPDPAVMVAQLFGARIRERVRQAEMGSVVRAFPNGYIAVQFSADFGDDDTLARLAVQLDKAASATGLGIVFFRAGAAPWHDDVACYERTATYMRGAAPGIFRSLNVWDICALIANSRCFAGSSLHGRIVAMAFALPRVNLRHPGRVSVLTKQASYAATWDDADMPGAVQVGEFSHSIVDALGTDKARRERRAGQLADLYRRGFELAAARMRL